MLVIKPWSIGTARIALNLQNYDTAPACVCLVLVFDFGFLRQDSSLFSPNSPGISSVNQADTELTEFCPPLPL